MAKNLDAYKLGVVLDASGAAKGIATLKDADKQAAKTYSSLQNLSKGFKLGLADKFKSELKDVENLSRSSAVGQMLGRTVGTGLQDGIMSVFNAKTLGSLIGTAIMPGIGTAAGSVIGSGIDAVVSKVSGPLMGLIDQGVELNKQLEVTQVHFTALTGDANGAGKLLNQIKELSARSGLDLPTILQGENRLEEFNSDLKVSVLELNAAADASRLFGSGVGGFNAIVDSLGLIAEKGELSSKVITRLYKQGVDVVGILSKASGKSPDWVKKRIAGGHVDGEWAAKTIAEGIEIEKRKRAIDLVNNTTQGQQDRFAALTALRAQEGTQALTGEIGQLYRGGNAVLGSSAAQQFTGFLNSASAGLLDLVNRGVKAGVDVTGGIITGMLGGVSLAKLKQAASDLAEKTEGALRDSAAFDSHSPARKMIPVGEDAAEGVIVGFEEYMNTKGRRRLTSSVDRLTQRQLDIAKKIVDIGRGMGANDKQIRAALATGLVESNLRNLGDLGARNDHQSHGVFQQQPFPEWGTLAQTMSVEHAARAFYEHAFRMDKPGLSAGELAARIQRPAREYRGRYAERMGEADELLSRIAVNSVPVSASNPVPVYVEGARNALNDSLRDLNAGVGAVRGAAAPYLPAVTGAMRGEARDVMDVFRAVGGAVSEAKPEIEQLPIISRTLDQTLSLIPPAVLPLDDSLMRGSQSIYLFSSTAKEAIDHMSNGVSKLDNVFASLGSITGLIPSQRVGKKRGFFSKLLGIAAPFLPFLPGGQVLSAIAGIGSRVAGGDYAGALAGVAAGFSKGGAFRSTPHSRIGDVTTSSSAGGNGLPYMAKGGPVRRGRAYVVGEYRNEIFEPNEDGWIHPSVQSYLRAGGGGGARVGGANFWRELREALDRNTESNLHNAQWSAALHDKIHSMPADHVLATGARTPAGQRAIVGGYHGGLRRSPSAQNHLQRQAAGVA